MNTGGIRPRVNGTVNKDGKVEIMHFEDPENYGGKIRIDPLHFDQSLISEKYKQYLLLIYLNTDDGIERTFEIITGRLDTYNYIKNNADIIDMNNSIITLTNKTIEEGITFLQFVRHLKDAELVPEDSFDISVYEDETVDYSVQNTQKSYAENINNMTDEELTEYCKHILGGYK